MHKGYILITPLRYKGIVEKADDDLKMATKAVETFCVNMENVVDSAKDSAIKKELEKLAEKFRYSDPISSTATKPLERDISEKIIELRQTVQNADNEQVTEKINEIRNLLNDRNRICKMNK